MILRTWKRVVDPAQIEEDGTCPNCRGLFDECGCPGPGDEGYDYRLRLGVNYGAKKVSPTTPSHE